MPRCSFPICFFSSFFHRDTCEIIDLFPFFNFFFRMEHLKYRCGQSFLICANYNHVAGAKRWFCNKIASPNQISSLTPKPSTGRSLLLRSQLESLVWICLNKSEGREDARRGKEVYGTAGERSIFSTFAVAVWLDVKISHTTTICH